MVNAGLGIWTGMHSLEKSNHEISQPRKSHDNYGVANLASGLVAIPHFGRTIAGA
jgi:hypothetical protein